MKKIDIRIPIIIVLSIILATMCYFYFKDDTTSYQNFKSNNKITKTNTSNGDSVILSTTSSVSSALNENIYLRSAYYFKKILVKENVVIKKGTKIIEYTNGKYLKAPYDLIITETNLPSSKNVCTSEHYITVSSFNVLSTSFRVDETKIDSISLGQTIKIKVPSLDDKEFTGYITNISSTANNGKFTVTAEFDNDGNVKLGMTVNIIV